MESISFLYAQTVNSFRKLLFALSADGCRVIAMGQVEVVEISDELGRLQIWGDQSKANMPEGARGSLDDFLRGNDSLKDVSRGILSQLLELINMAILIAERKYDLQRGEDQDSISSVSADSDSDLHIDEKTMQDRRRIPKIRFIISQVHDQLRSLYRLAVTLRRSAVIGRYLRSRREGPLGILESSFQEYDYHHVCEKALQWKDSTKAAIAIRTEEEEAVSIESIPSGSPFERFDERLETLVRRLADANTKRREQLQYWIAHPDTSELAGAAVLPPPVDPKVETQTQVSTGTPGRTVTQGSLKSSQGFSTVAKSAMANMTEFGRPVTEYAETVVGSKQSTRVPDIPRTAQTEATFECPYCHQQLESEGMRIRRKWKRHVFRDLRPYVCTAVTCQQSEKLYATRHEWVYHEMQMHRRRWICDHACGQVCESRNAMESHLTDSHNHSVAAAQVQIMVDMSERPGDDSQASCCPLCGLKSTTVRHLNGHLAQHMEELSLFVLSRSCEEESETASLASKRAARSSPDQLETYSGMMGSGSGISSSDSGSSQREGTASNGEARASPPLNSEQSFRLGDVLFSDPHDEPQSVDNFHALIDTAELNGIEKSEAWVSNAVHDPSGSEALQDDIPRTVDGLEPVIPVRELKDEERTMTDGFEQHASNCSRCKDPVSVSQFGRNLCDIGKGYAIEVAHYLYAGEGKVWGTRDRDLGRPTVVNFPRNYHTTHQLILAIDNGLVPNSQIDSSDKSDSPDETEPPNGVGPGPSMAGWWKCCCCSNQNNPVIGVTPYCTSCTHMKCSSCYIY